MLTQNNEINDTQEYLSRYFQELSHGIQNTQIRFNGADELINFALLDIVTSLFHARQKSNKERFICNLESILSGIKKYHDQEKTNDSASKAQEMPMYVMPVLAS